MTVLDEDTILSLCSIMITIIVMYALRGFYIEYAIYFGWVTLFIVHLIITWVGITLVVEKIKYFLKLK